MLMVFKCVIFDFHNTLLDHSGTFNKLKGRPHQQEVLARHGFCFTAAEIKSALCKTSQAAKGFSDSERQKPLFYALLFLKALGVKPKVSLARELESAYYAKELENSVLFPDAVPLLKLLKKRKKILCVVSNTKNSTNLKIAKKLGIRKYFRHFLMSHLFGSVKSELAIFRHLLQKLNKGRKNKILPSECLMVGNNVLEDGAAKKLGMKVAILKATIDNESFLKELNPDYLIGGLKDLERIA